MINVILYSRDDCHLCEVVIQQLASIRSDIPHELIIIDVDSDPDLQKAYGLELPVVKVGPYTLKAPIEEQDLRITLSAAKDRSEQLISLKDPNYEKMLARTQSWNTADKLTYWIGKHYLAVFNFFVLIYLGLPVLAPFLMGAGIEGPARLIYRAYGIVCHQLAYRSFFVSGEQAVYPRETAGVEGVLTFNQATGMSEAADANALNAARNFVGNQAMGYKIGLCQRDVAIYGAILLFGLLFAITGRRIPMLPWYLWVLIGLVPIGIDGTSQLLSQPPFSFFASRESTPFLRVITGGLFGFTTAWFGYPMVEQTMAETRQIMAAKYQRLTQKYSKVQATD